MTIEEKAKRYDEALEKAKIEINTKGIGEAVDLCYQLFPQLTESEDERIRKELKEAFEAYDIESKWNGIPIRSIFAWLEKQKEQNGEDEKCTDFTIYHPQKNGKGKYECIPFSFYGSLTSFSEDKDLIDFLRTCFYTEEECNEWIKQQEEQEPLPPFDEFSPEGKMNHPLYLEGFDTGRKVQKVFDEQKPLPFSCSHENDKPLDNWKPSEEQMAALEAATVRYQSTGLESLYEELKKL